MVKKILRQELLLNKLIFILFKLSLTTGFIIDPVVTLANPQEFKVKNIQVTVSKDCKSQTHNIKPLLNSLLDAETSSVISSIKTLRGQNSIDRFQGLKINIEDFGTQKDFRGFFKHHNHESQIWLDCSYGSILSWQGLLAHELTHYANRDLNLPSWLDEMLAQMVEARAQARFPLERSEILRSSAVLPGFINLEKPFTRQADYATSLLFGFYIYQNFSGFEFFPSLQRPIQDFDSFIQLLREFTNTRSELNWIKNYVTSRNIIQNFHLAMNINLPMLNHGSLYQVPGWQGFSKDSVIKKKGTYFLEPASSMRLDSELLNSDFQNSHEDLAFYRILKSQGNFKIQNLNEKIDRHWDENFILIINRSSIQAYEVEL